MGTAPPVPPSNSRRQVRHSLTSAEHGEGHHDRIERRRATNKKRFVVRVPADCTYVYEVEAEHAEEALDLVERGEAGEYELQTEGYAQPRSEWSWQEVMEGEEREDDRLPEGDAA